MKKIVLLCFILLTGLFAKANENIISGEITFDWVNMSQVQRESAIEQYQKYIFEDNAIHQYTKKEFNEKYSLLKKDKNHKEHYRKTKMGQTETEDANLCAFFYKNDILLIYAIQYKNNPKVVYYYDAYGHLKYIDEISDNYPNFPYFSKQYRANGKLISAIYFISPDTQYMYKPDGKFEGLWHKEKMYDKNGKQTLKRTNWGV